MPTGVYGKVQRSFWLSKVAAEKFRRMVAARGGRCGVQVAEEAVNLLYMHDPVMANQPPIPGDAIGPSAAARLKPEKVEPKDALDEIFDAAARLRNKPR